MSDWDRSGEQLLQKIAGPETQVSELKASLSKYESGKNTGLQPELEANFQALPDLYFCIDADGTALELRALNSSIAWLCLRKNTSKNMEKYYSGEPPGGSARLKYI
jgi:hypothetical protein